MKIFLTLFFLAAFSMQAHAVEVNLAWDAVEAKDLAGYRIYYKPFGGDFDYENPVYQGLNTFCTVDVPGDGYFIARSYDTMGQESANSNVATLDTIPPKVQNLLIESYKLMQKSSKAINESMKSLQQAYRLMKQPK